jgi:hypothetical protein
MGGKEKRGKEKEKEEKGGAVVFFNCTDTLAGKC